MTWDTLRLSRLIEAARGARPCDLLLRGCRVANVFSGAVEAADIALFDGRIAGFGPREAKEVVECRGLFALPGLIDAHIHIESTMLAPASFARAALPWGTTCVVSDPHEIANVLGLPGIRWMLAASEGLPVDVFMNLPSCVPATHLETSGARLSAADLFSLLPHPRIPGLAEMMNFPGVVSGAPDVMEKLALFSERPRDGHAPGLSGAALHAYAASGVSTDHECTTAEEAGEKLALGMAVMLREGSQSKDLAALLPAVTEAAWPRCMFATDDRHPDDLAAFGHMNAVVNRAVALGCDPLRAVTLSGLTAARHFGLGRRGALAPGYVADIVLSPALSPVTPVAVYKNGVLAAREGNLLPDAFPPCAPPPPPESPMRCGAVTGEALAVSARAGSLRVIGAREGTLLTEALLVAPRMEAGRVAPDPSRDISKLVVCNRYEAGRAPAVGFVSGLGLARGALATTVAHDSHNLIGAGASDAALARVMNAVREAGGGMAAGGESGEIALLPLPVAGLMSGGEAPEVASALSRLKAVSRELGSGLSNPFMCLSFLSLPVIPALRLTDRGLVDVSRFDFVPLFE